MKPALTAEEWEKNNQVPVGKDGIMCGCYIWDEDKHAMAARCLRDQPFGFTREDVEMCRRFDVMMNFKAVSNGEAWLTIDAMEYFKDLASRIEALLPPEDEE